MQRSLKKAMSDARGGDHTRPEHRLDTTCHRFLLHKLRCMWEESSKTRCRLTSGQLTGMPHKNTSLSDEINELQYDWTEQWGTIDEADLQEKETTLVRARVAET